MIYYDSRNLRSSREQVIHKASVEKLTFFIVHEPLIIGPPNSLCHATMHLPLDNRGINHVSAIMHSRIFKESHHARLWINLDDGSVDPAGKTAMRRAIKPAGFKARPPALRWQTWSRARTCQLHRHELPPIFTVALRQWLTVDRQLAQCKPTMGSI